MRSRHSTSRTTCPSRSSLTLCCCPPTSTPQLNDVPGRQASFSHLAWLILDGLRRSLISLVGREEVVAEAKRLLAGTRLLTLVGPGGIGKTRLSLQIAAEVVQGFPDGVYFVQLSAVRDSELIASVIAQAMGIAVPGNRMPIEVVNEYLRDRTVLLILDNLEQLLPEGGPVVAELLHASPGVKVVASSRAALHIYGEQEMAIQPLRLPDLRALPSLEAL